MREERRLICKQGHTFDVARSNYINLLQPQDRRSRQPGDTVRAVQARRRLHDLGVTQGLLREVSGMLTLTQEDAVLDAGCGEGFYLGSLTAQNGLTAAGMDISVPAIDTAAKRYPGCEWVVGNADRLVPYEFGSFSLVMSITARMNAEEFRRVLRDQGRMLIAIPAPDDLIELRGVGRERRARTIATFSKGFKLIEEKRATTTAELEADAIQDILTSIYRPMQSRMPSAMRVTFSLDLLLFEAI